jgi:hypothetical protein
MCFKRNPKFGQNREFSWTQENSENRKYVYVKIKKHELYHIFDEDHEYVVFLCVELIFTELLTEMRKPEVEKKSKNRKFDKWAFLVE